MKLHQTFFLPSLAWGLNVGDVCYRNCGDVDGNFDLSTNCPFSTLCIASEDSYANKEICGHEEGSVKFCADNCSEHGSDCNACLSSNSGCVFTIGECMSGCFVSDVSCYTASEPALAEEVCRGMDYDVANAAMCSEKTTCSECVSTPLWGREEDNGNCMWHEGWGDGGFCMSECGMIGCGQSECFDPCSLVVCAPFGCDDPWCQKCEDGQQFDSSLGCCGGCIDGEEDGAASGGASDNNSTSYIDGDQDSDDDAGSATDNNSTSYIDGDQDSDDEGEGFGTCENELSCEGCYKLHNCTYHKGGGRGYCSEVGALNDGDIYIDQEVCEQFRFYAESGGVPMAVPLLTVVVNLVVVGIIIIT